MRDPHELELLMNLDSARSSDSFAPSLLPSCQAHASAEFCIAVQPAFVDAVVHAFSCTHGHDMHIRVHINTCPTLPNY